ncbi:MAG: DUF427 domain-containing protein [Bacteroidales bacterium]|nr:DUF427 domain-containing protein [Bacteroidales bacterium]
MIKALYKGIVIAESNDTIKVEGNHYFPIDSIKNEYLKKSNLKTTCPWKGVANYYHFNFEGEKLKDVIWYYPEPNEKAKQINNRIAFYQKDGIEVIEE